MRKKIRENQVREMEMIERDMEFADRIMREVFGR